MSQLLIVEPRIIAQGPFTQTDTEIRSTDAVYPKSVLGDWQIFNVTLPADFTVDTYEWVAGALQKKPTMPPSAADIAAFLRQIDVDVDAIYATVIGHRQSEYEIAEKQAEAYKAAGYTGTVPPMVQIWATAKTQTATWAADDIIAVSALWRGAQLSMREHRLQKKEDAKVAVSVAALNTIKQNWAAYIKSLRASLGI